MFIGILTIKSVLFRFLHLQNVCFATMYNYTVQLFYIRYLYIYLQLLCSLQYKNFTLTHSNAA